MAEKPYRLRAANDAASARRVDVDGHLHVTGNRITKAGVSEYYGREIPTWTKLGLNPDQRYQVFRDPAELEKSAATFDGKPLLLGHTKNPEAVTTAADHDFERTVGAINNVRWEAPYLIADIAVWDEVAIAGITTCEQDELSASYRYDPVVESGNYQGAAYQIRMANIVANHEALVPRGRAGSDVAVADAEIQPKEPTMARTLSRTALLASGALNAYVRPKLAKGAKVDIAALVAGVSAKTWKADKPRIKAAMDAALVGKFAAADADIADVVEMLDQLDGVVDEQGDGGPNGVVQDAEGLSDEEEAKFQELSKRRKPAVADADPPVPPKVDPAAKDPKEPTVSKAAMDAAISAAANKARDEAVTATMLRMRAVQEAEKIVRPFIGDVLVANDSAEDVYKLALDMSGVETKDVPPAAYKAMVGMLQRPGAGGRGNGNPQAAMDAAATAEADFFKRYPTASRLVRS